MSKSDEMNFTWGMAQQVLNELGYLQISGFMLDHYIDLGATRTEFLCLMHLARYHYNSENGVARPSLETIATQMGHKGDSQVRRLVRQLERKGLLRITWVKGKPSKYDASPFAQAAYDLWFRTKTGDDREAVARELREKLEKEAKPLLKQRPKAGWGEDRYTGKDDESLPF